MRPPQGGSRLRACQRGPERVQHSPGGRAGGGGWCAWAAVHAVTLCQSLPKTAESSESSRCMSDQSAASPEQSKSRSLKTCAQNHTERQGDRSEDYTHPFLHPSSFSLSLSITHVLSLALSGVSLLSHYEHKAESRASLRLIQLERTAANETVSLSFSLIPSLSLSH